MVKAILGDMLGQNYVIAPGVQGTVTLATPKPVSPAEAMSLLEMVLGWNNARMVYSDYPCYSPIFCASGTGFFLEAIYRHGGTEPSVIETKCQTLGDHTCTYEMTWR